MTSKELVKVLMQDGWQEKAQRGSHLQLVHPTKPGKVTVPIHRGDIPIGTLRAILQTSRLEIEAGSEYTNH